MMTYRQKLEKCKKSLEAHASRGNTPAGQRSMDLIDRYNNLRFQIIENDAASKEWGAYCKANELAFGHDAGDFFA